MDSIKTKKKHDTGKEHPYDAEYDFVSQFPLRFKGCFICGATNRFLTADYPVGLILERRGSYSTTKCGLINRILRRGLEMAQPSEIHHP